MHYPAILFAVAIATCIINTVYAGSYYNPDHTTAPVTPGGFGVWSDAPLPPPEYTSTQPNQKRRLKYNNGKRTVIPAIDALGDQNGVLDKGFNILNRELKQQMKVALNEGYYSMSKRRAHHKIILETEATTRPAITDIYDNKKGLYNLIPGNTAHRKEKTKRKRVKTASITGKSALIMYK